MLVAGSLVSREDDLAASGEVKLQLAAANGRTRRSRVKDPSGSVIP